MLLVRRAAIVPVSEAAGGTVTRWRGGDPRAERTPVAGAGDLHAEVRQLPHGA